MSLLEMIWLTFVMPILYINYYFQNNYSSFVCFIFCNNFKAYPVNNNCEEIFYESNINLIF